MNRQLTNCNGMLYCFSVALEPHRIIPFLRHSDALCPMDTAEGNVFFESLLAVASGMFTLISHVYIIVM